jgi:hypothetical protein
MTPEQSLVVRLEAASRRWWVPRRLSALLTEAAARIAFLAEMEDMQRAARYRVQDRADALIAAGNRLSMMAQTTGGTAGPDPGLQNAIAGWEAATGGPKRPTRPVGVDGGTAR